MTWALSTLLFISAMDGVAVAHLFIGGGVIIGLWMGWLWHIYLLERERERERERRVTLSL
jgi:hypothetical protein